MATTTVRNRIIPFFRPTIGAAEIAAITDCLRGGWLTSGPRVGELELKLAELCGRRFAVALNSATSALHVLLRLAGVRPGDEVITTPFTFVATAEAALYLGARPVFADVDDATLNLDPDSVERLITRRTRVIMPVHFAGHLCDMPALLRIARRHGLAVVEDAAHALSARAGAWRCGDETLGAALSFYATKELTVGEGGALVTDDAAVAERARCLALHGLSRDAWTRYRPGSSARYDVVDLGYKMNLPDVLAALGLPQIERLAEQRARREAIARRYDQALAGLPGIRTPIVRRGHVSSRHLYVIRVEPERARRSRDELALELGDRGIATSVHFRPLFEMTYYRNLGYTASACPVAARAGREVLSLPIYPELADADQDCVVNAVREVILRSGR
ncbi:MAG: DegT/DnrJ/EryC1/StrS aminotransferase family protein [Planctomycetota bacterium]